MYHREQSMDLSGRYGQEPCVQLWNHAPKSLHWNQRDSQILYMFLGEMSIRLWVCQAFLTELPSVLDKQLLQLQDASSSCLQPELVSFSNI